MPASDLYDAILSMTKVKYPELKLTVQNKALIKQMVDSLSAKLKNQNLSEQELDRFKAIILKKFIHQMHKKQF